MTTINANQLKDLMDRDDDVPVIDVLPEDKYEKEHIPGAHSVPLADPNFVNRIDELVDSRDEEIVVYCANAECDLSPKATKKLQEEGFSNVMDFEGGLEEWKNAGFEVTGGAAASTE